MTNRITDILVFVLISGLATIVRVLHDLHKSGKINWLKAITRLIIGCILAGLCATIIPDGYSFFGMTKLQTTAVTAFSVGLLGIEIIDFIVSKDINYFLDLLLKKK